MAHGDDNGLIVPPRLAPTQLVVVAVRDEPEVNEACARVAGELSEAGVRVEIDRGRGSFGRRVTDWEIKGIPLRLEVGPRDWPKATSPWYAATLAPRRLTSSTRWRATFPRCSSACRATCWRAPLPIATRQPRTSPAWTKRSKPRATASLVSPGTSSRARARQPQRSSRRVRCLQRQDGSMPESEEEGGLICLVSKSY